MKDKGNLEMSQPEDALFGEVAEIEREPVDETGLWISLHETAPDGRERWAVFDQHGQRHGIIWSKSAALAAARELAATGQITRG